VSLSACIIANNHLRLDTFTRLAHQHPRTLPLRTASAPSAYSARRNPSATRPRRRRSSSMPSATGQSWEKYQKNFADDEVEEKKITPLTDE
jgi:hypothetical protein